MNACPSTIRGLGKSLRVLGTAVSLIWAILLGVPEPGKAASFQNTTKGPRLTVGFSVGRESGKRWVAVWGRGINRLCPDMREREVELTRAWDSKGRLLVNGRAVLWEGRCQAGWVRKGLEKSAEPIMVCPRGGVSSIPCEGMRSAEVP
jgi:hypothetical protein